MELPYIIEQVNAAENWWHDIGAPAIKALNEELNALYCSSPNKLFLASGGFSKAARGKIENAIAVLEKTKPENVILRSLIKNSSFGAGAFYTPSLTSTSEYIVYYEKSRFSHYRVNEWLLTSHIGAPKVSHYGAPAKWHNLNEKAVKKFIQEKKEIEKEISELQDRQRLIDKNLSKVWRN